MLPRCFAKWLKKIRIEVKEAAVKHGTKDPNASILDKLSDLTLDAWESKFPVIQLCLRDSIRLNMPGVFFRKNLSKTIPSRPDTATKSYRPDPSPSTTSPTHTGTQKYGPSLTSEILHGTCQNVLKTRSSLASTRAGEWGGILAKVCGSPSWRSIFITAFCVAALNSAGGLEDENGCILDDVENGNVNDIANNVPKKPFILRFTRQSDPFATAV